MAAFGNGDITEIAGSEATAIAAASTTTVEPKLTEIGVDGLALGDQVEVLPIDYGFQPTQGELLFASLEELVVSRTDADAGKVAVHFPRLGFRVNKL